MCKIQNCPITVSLVLFFYVNKRFLEALKKIVCVRADMNLDLEFVDFFQYLRIDISIAVEISARTLYALLKQAKRKRGKRPTDTRTQPIYFLSKFNDLNTFF